mgnify:CR=1 FL=1
MGTTTDKRRFGGIERVYGPTAAQAFTRLHVTIVGMGGVGSWAVESPVPASGNSRSWTET